MSDFLSRVKRRALLVGGPSDGQDIPMPLPEGMAPPPFICTGGPGPKPTVWQHYVYDGDGLYGHVGPCAEIDHQGGAPHDHCDHEWDDESGPGHRCVQVYGHDGDHVCGCCHANGGAS